MELKISSYGLDFLVAYEVDEDGDPKLTSIKASADGQMVDMTEFLHCSEHTQGVYDFILDAVWSDWEDFIDSQRGSVEQEEQYRRDMIDAGREHLLPGWWDNKVD